MLAIFFLVLLVVVLVLWRRHSRFAFTPAIERAPEKRAAGTLKTVRFAARDGTELEGWLITPGRERPPVVIMAPGLTGTKEGFLEPFAWAFAERGLAVLMIDFRTLGGSGGFPRHHVDPFLQVEDYRSALAWVRAQPELDGSRIALWGSSFSGGVSVVTASEDPAIRAVVAQCPFLATPASQEPSGWSMIRFVAAAVLDSVGPWPVYIPALGRPHEFAFARSEDNPSVRDPIAHPGTEFWRALPKHPRGGWENRFRARMLTRFDDFKPMDSLHKVRCPTLIVAAEHDDLVPLEQVKRAPHAELHVFPCRHFELYVGPHAQPNAELQARFLAERLDAPVL
ncbi:MAG: alpha/beta fold hydrolase [Archangium sp.]